MAPDVAPSLERLIDHYLPVAPAGIEAEFERIWHDASTGDYDSSSVRMRVSNIVAWGPEPLAAPSFERMMDALAQQHPCRALLAVTAADATTLESAISAHCWRTASGGRHICSEEIVLRAATGGEHALASAVLALLVPELPVHLWLAGEPAFRTAVPEDLLRVVDVIYVDAARGLPPAALRALLDASAEEGPVIVDLAWRRAHAWRDLAAQFFDSPVTAPELDRITSINVEGGDGAISADALLVAGWLISRLALSAASVTASPTGIRATFYDGARGVGLRVTPSDEGSALGSISLSTPSATWAVGLHTSSGHLHARSDFEGEPVHRTVSIEAGDDASLIAAALDEPGQPAVYLESLAAAVALAEGA